MIADNFTEAISHVPQVFWSGSSVKESARSLANAIGGKTITMTRVGEYLNAIDASETAWRAASANFANVASNASRAIYCLQSSTGVAIDSIWATVEYSFVYGREIVYIIIP